MGVGRSGVFVSCSAAAVVARGPFSGSGEHLQRVRALVVSFCSHFRAIQGCVACVLFGRLKAEAR